jgi:hypothetical protein
VLILKISYIHGHDLYYAAEFLINNYKRLYATNYVARVDVFVDWLLLNLKKIVVGSESKFTLHSLLSGLIEVILESDCNPLPETLINIKGMDASRIFKSTTNRRLINRKNQGVEHSRTARRVF